MKTGKRATQRLGQGGPKSRASAAGLPAELAASATNRAALAHLEGASAHSDVASAFTAAVKRLGDVQLHCPDWQQYRCVTASTRQVIFGFAIGMSTVAFRLGDRMKARALASGGEAYPACGPEWVAFDLFRADWPRVDCEFWALKAYGYVREFGR